MISKTRIVAMLLGGIVALVSAPDVQAAAPNSTDAEMPAASIDGRKDEVDRAIERALAFLLKQQHDEGWINHKPEFETAMTSLVLMSLAATGHQPNDPTPEGRSMRRGIAYVLREDRQTADGYFGQADASRMYGHGITTLLLTELLGMGQDRQQDALIRGRCQKAVELILRAQRTNKREMFIGGWRYRPDSPDADMSVSAWQVMALRSAHNAGLQVPNESVDQAVAYFKRSYLVQPLPAGHADGPYGGFGYTYDPKAKKLNGASPAAGLLAMQVCGKYDAPEVVGTADWLMDNPPKWGPYWGPLFYNLYYFNQGMFQRGGKHASFAMRLTQELLLKNQRPDGSWESPELHERGTGAVYTTTLGILALAVKYHYLPIYQR